MLLVAIAVGGALFGLWGLFFAVPLVAAGKVVVLYLWDTRSQWPPRVASGPQGVAAVTTSPRESPADDPPAEGAG